MKIVLADIAASLENGRKLITAVVQQTDSGPDRASLLVKTLRSLWPAYSLYACLLSDELGSRVSVLDEAGNSRPEWAEKMQKELVEPAVCGETKRVHSQRPLRGLGLRGQALVIEPVTLRDRFQGALALGLPQTTSDEMLMLARFWLSACAESLGSQLQLEAHERERQTWKEESKELTWMANLGELARPVTHEFNNFLNAVLLQLAALEPELPERIRSDLAELRFQGNRIGGLVKQFQQYRNREASIPRPTDLNQAVKQAVEALRGPSPEMSLSLAPDLPPVSATMPVLKQLCTWLLANAVAALAPGGGHIWVRTVFANEHVQIRVEDTGSPIAPELLPKLFNPLIACREGTNSLELAACQTLVRRLHGKITCENRAEGGVAMIVKLPSSM